MKNKTLVTIAVLGFLMSGCASGISNQVSMQNKLFKQDQMPIRLYKTKSTEKADFYQSNWAGEKGESIAINSKVLYSDILNGFKQTCGF